ncbi:MAG: hypothetical protein K8I29_16140 [Alphaproteobacteria bacterium]|uniref:Uncharacterized protein n=1 Tax=Candidatus Nitrobium versatile TaxID=2884831 RepID=A0A953M2F9_9BACT|nr:hypothetical protein [Candidatus Nitrobium versatile]
MGGHTEKNIISILQESPLYALLSTEEERCLLARLTESYPFLIEEEQGEGNSGDEANWTVILKGY